MATRKLLKKIVKNGVAYELPSSEDFVDLSSNQEVGWAKTFTTSPTVPNKTSSATNDWTKIATEKQVYDVAQSIPDSDDYVDKTTAQTVWGVKTFTSEIVLPSKDSAVGTSKTAPATEYQVKAVKDAIPTKVITKSELDTWTNTDSWLITAKAVADYVSGRVGTAVNYKGQVTDYSDLPNSPTTWDMYNVVNAHTTAPTFDAWTNVVWNWTSWDPMAEMVDLSNLVDKTTAQTVGWVKTFTSEPVLPSKTTSATNDWTKPATEAQVYKKLDTDDLGNATISVKYTDSSTSVGSFTTNQSTAWTLIIPWDVFLDQDDYDDLPSSKTSDNNSYAIYEEITVS